MISKPLTSITPVDLTALVASGVRESRELEFKRELPGTSDRDRVEFLADVSSLANAAGGDLLFGIEGARDKDGRCTGAAANVIGLRGFNADQDELRLMQMVRTGIAPVIPGIEMQAVDGFADGAALVLRVPKSWLGPHMITFQGKQQFWGRSAAGKHRLDVAELREAFLSADEAPRRLQAVRTERIARILAGDVPAPMDDRSIAVLHVAPMAALGRGHLIDIHGVRSLNLQPMKASGWDGRYNAEGYAFHGCRGGGPRGSYVQFFRSSLVEVASDHLVGEFEGRRVIASDAYESDLIRSAFAVVRGLHQLGLPLPYFIAATLLGAAGARMDVNSFRYRDAQHPIERDVLYLPDIQIESVAERVEEILGGHPKPASDGHLKTGQS